MSATIINLIIQLIAGAIGGNVVGTAAKNVNLGTDHGAAGSLYRRAGASAGEIPADRSECGISRAIQQAAGKAARQDTQARPAFCAEIAAVASWWEN